MKTLKKKELTSLYEQYVSVYESYLKKHGVKFLKYRNKKVSQALYGLLFLLKYKGEVVTKKELTDGWNLIGTPTNDFQQGRHLALQDGYYIQKSGSKKEAWYKLVTLRKPHPSFIPNRRNEIFTEEEWLELKDETDNRCLTCGSFEGEQHYKDNTLIVKLEKGHCDPRLELTLDNVFPQCSYCNQLYKDKFVFDKRGNIKYQITR
jgi:hypothetical protein